MTEERGGGGTLNVKKSRRLIRTLWNEIKRLSVNIFGKQPLLKVCRGGERRVT